MMQLARRASLVVVLLILASVGTASAECAWVLWSEFSVFGDDPLNRWTIHATYPSASYMNCVSDARAQAERYPAGPNVLSVEVSELPGNQFAQTMKFKIGRSWHWTKYGCYPDTIDPRGAKGK
jgi:hypothetical protein